MAPTQGLSAPGSASYSSNTMTVGDGTWDFTKNTFLLPNLVGLNFETMQYNGMGNRFASIAQYHSLITGHGVLATLSFLFLVPIAIMYARFHPDRRTGRRIHAYLQVLAFGLTTAAFILGFFAVGPSRNLTNPHHGIGVAIYVLMIVQIIGGSMIRRILKKSLRLMVHRWFGVITGLLGLIQIPLGLTLYGSPKVTFILYALWVGFLVFLYFILSWRHENDWDDNMTNYGGRSHGGRSESGAASEYRSERGFGWLEPIIAGIGALALLGGRRQYDEENSHSGYLSQSGRTPEVVPSRRGSTSYYMGTEKYSDRSDHREGGGGLMNKLFAAGGALAAGALFKKIKDRRDDRSYGDEYSAIAPDTPSRTRPPPSRIPRKQHDDYTESEFTEDRTELGTRPRTPLLQGSGGPVATTVGYSSVGGPSTPRASHARPAPSSHLYSDYSSYVSPSRRTREDESHDGVNKGLLAALGVGWFVRKMRGRQARRAEDERLRLEEERRDRYERHERYDKHDRHDRHDRHDKHGSSYTGDDYGSPAPRRRPPVGAPTTTIMSEDTESSHIEARPPGTSLIGPPMPPLGAGSVPSVPLSDSVSMPSMPPDPQGVLHRDSDVDSTLSASERLHRQASRRQRDSELAAAAAAASAAGLAAEEQRYRDQSRVSQPVSVVKVKYHDDRDRNVTLRRLTEDEARREQRRGRSASVSSLSGTETPNQRRYRRDGSARRTIDETEAERLVGEPLSPPTPALTGPPGPRRGGKDSAYYSGQPGPSLGSPPGAMPPMSSSLGTDSHGTWSALSPTPSGAANRPPPSVGASAAERRRRRRLERNREAKPPSDSVDLN
ncbi:hypothetical protein GGS21DRAFT_510525 [Xylaria nigripes]|nr:hypothetical protein GGS21DRAFT_510525 [Xylaria nigripes]